MTKKTILLVEDEVIIAKYQKSALEAYNYQVILAYSAVEAIKKFHENCDIDLILMDINLGIVMDGIQVAEVLLKEKKIPIVFLSSYTSQEIVEKTEKITSYGYIVKGANITVIDASIKMAFKLFDAYNLIQKQHRDSEILLNSFLDYSDEYMGIIEVLFETNDIRYKRINKAAGNYLNMAPEKIKNMLASEIGIPAETRRLWLEKCHLSADTGKTHRFEYQREVDGKIYTLETALTVLSTPIFSFVVKDITEQVIVDKRLKESEEKFRTTFNSIGDAIIVTDTGANITYINKTAEQLTGWSPEEASRKNINTVFNIVDSRTNKPVLNPVNLVLKTGKQIVLSNHTSLITKNGNQIQIADSGAPIKNDNEEITGVILLFQDVSQRYKEHEELKERNKELRCIYSISNVVENFSHLPEILQEIANVIPQGWQYPEDTCCKISFNNDTYISNNYCSDFFNIENNLQFQKQHIMVHQKSVGELKVAYVEEKPLLDEGPFLQQERKLLNSIAERLGRIIERIEAENKLMLSDQIVNNIQVGLHIYNLKDIKDDHSLTMIFANETSSELTGVPAKDIIGKTIDENFPGLREKGIPQVYADVVRTGKSKVLEDIYYKDERVISGVFSVKAFPLPNDCVGVSFEKITEQKIAEFALKNSELKFRVAFKNANIGICIVDLNGMLLEVNDTMCIIFGYSKSELERMNVNDITFDEDKNISPQYIEKAIEGQVEKTTFEKRYYHKTGKIITCTVSSSLVKSDNNEPLFFISHVQDITEQKSIEKNLITYKNIFSISDDLISVIDRNYKYLLVNETYLKMFGKKREEIEGKTTLQVAGEKYFYEIAKQKIDRCFNGEVVKFESWFDFPKRGKRCFSVVYYPFQKCNNNVEYIIIQAKDITEQKYANEKIEDLSLFPEENTYPVFRISPDGFLIYANKACQLIFINKDIKVGEKISDAWLELLKEVWIAKEITQLTIPLNDKYYIFTVIPLTKKDYLNVYAVDITNLKKALTQNELLLSEIQHRVKNSFALISSMVELAISSNAAENEIIVLKNINHRIKAVSEMYSLLYQNKNFHEINMKQYLLKLLSTLIIPANIKIVSNFVEFTLSVKNGIYIGLIVVELVTNAVKYAYPVNQAGTVHINSIEKQNKILLEIIDNGIGIQNNKKSLGLQLVEDLCSSINGQFSIDSKNGTTCQLIFEASC